MLPRILASFAATASWFNISGQAAAWLRIRVTFGELTFRVRYTYVYIRLGVYGMYVNDGGGVTRLPVLVTFSRAILSHMLLLGSLD